MTNPAPLSPAAVVSDRPVQAGAAVPVVAYAPGDRPVTAGAAQPVYLVTDADVAAGRFRIAAQAPVPLVAAPAGAPVDAGPALPVYVVAGGALGLPASAGLGLWYDGPDLALRVSSGAALGAVRDLSGSGRGGVATSATLGTLQGKPAIACGGAGYVTDSATFVLSQGFTGMVAVQVTTLAASSRLMAIDGGGAGRRLVWYVFTSGAMIADIFSDAANRIGRSAASAMTAGAVAVLSCTYDGTATAAGIKTYKNGARVDNANDNNGAFTSAAASSVPLTVSSNVAPLQGAIGAALAWNRVLSDAERLACERWLGARFGIGVA